MSISDYVAKAYGALKKNLAVRREEAKRHREENEVAMGMIEDILAGAALLYTGKLSITAPFDHDFAHPAHKSRIGGIQEQHGSVGAGVEFFLALYQSK